MQQDSPNTKWELQSKQIYFDTILFTSNTQNVFLLHLSYITFRNNNLIVENLKLALGKSCFAELRFINT
jgi:hypothetical protein